VGAFDFDLAFSLQCKSGQRRDRAPPQFDAVEFAVAFELAFALALAFAFELVAAAFLPRGPSRGRLEGQAGRV
jgi:hypothetical protein